jgi:hypothetical protein
MAQSGIARITGIVSDPSGAAVANCEVSVTNMATGIVNKTRTNESGVFLLPSLVAGPYTAIFQSAGFNKREIQGLVLRTGRRVPSLVHTAVRGRARLRIAGLRTTEALKMALEFDFDTSNGVRTLSANSITGNVLVAFSA